MTRGRSTNQGEIPRGARGVAAAGLLLVVIYAVAAQLVFIVDSPGASVVPKAVPPVAYFSQNWKLFSPVIAKSDEEFEVQARWRDSAGTIVTGEWASATAIEHGAIRDRLVPLLAGTGTGNLARSYRNSELMRTDRPERFAIAESMALRYASAFAATVHGADGDIVQVRWRVITAPVNSFEDRADLSRPPTESITAEWMDAEAVSAETIREYSAVFERYGDPARLGAAP